VGLFEADCSFDRLKDHVVGQYVYMLDDDDYLVDCEFVAELKKLVLANDFPDAIMVKAIFPEGVYPIPWQHRPVLCQIGSLNYVMRQDLWKLHIHEFCKDHRGGDFQVITKLFETKQSRIIWWDRIVAKVPQVGLGRPEAELRTQSTP